MRIRGDGDGEMGAWARGLRGGDRHGRGQRRWGFTGEAAFITPVQSRPDVGEQHAQALFCMQASMLPRWDGTTGTQNEFGGGSHPDVLR